MNEIIYIVCFAVGTISLVILLIFLSTLFIQQCCNIFKALNKKDSKDFFVKIAALFLPISIFLILLGGHINRENGHYVFKYRSTFFFVDNYKFFCYLTDFRIFLFFIAVFSLFILIIYSNDSI